MARTLRQIYRDKPPGLHVTLLEGLTKLCSLVLVLCGLAMVGYAGYICIGGDSFLHAASECPWEVYAFGAVGMLVAITAVMALLGPCLRSPTCLSISTIMLCVTGAVQTCLAVELFTDKSWHELLPPITSDDYWELRQLIQEHLTVCKWVGVGVCILEVVTFVLSWMLNAAYSSALEAAEDEETAAAWRQPLIDSRRRSAPVVLPTPVQRSDSWSRRMSEQYGLDTSNLSYDPEGRQEQQAPVVTRKSQESRCAVM